MFWYGFSLVYNLTFWFSSVRVEEGLVISLQWGSILLVLRHWVTNTWHFKTMQWSHLQR